MEYHEIGESFEFDGVILKPVQSFDLYDCKICYFGRSGYCKVGVNKYCGTDTRKDGKSIYYSIVEQCNTKDMKQKTEINIEEVKREMAELIKKETDKWRTPPAGIKTIPKRRIYYKDILDKLYETYKAKDQDYGSAFSEMFDELGIDYAYGKLREKMNRIKALRKQPNMVDNEGLEDALLDTAGYAILTLVELKKRKGNGKSE